MAKTKKEQKDKVISLWTPSGRFLNPFFSKPDVGRNRYSDNKYKTDFLIEKPTFKLKGGELEAAVREVGKAYFGSSYKINDPKYRSPFKDMDKQEKVFTELLRGNLLIRAKASGGGTSGKEPKQPVFIAARKDASGTIPELKESEVAKIKGGDWGKLNILVVPYEGSDGDKDGGNKVLPGVTFILNGVQYWKPGEGFGGGKMAMISTAEEYEEEYDSPDSDEDEDVAESAEEVDDGDDSVV